MLKKGFEGWYFKHQQGDKMLAFIPGIAESGAFIQMINDRGSRQFGISSLNAAHGVIKAGDCLFTRQGVVINLPGVTGRLVYGPLTPLKYDIMGPFQYLPMQCRHGVISMGHTVSGSLAIDGDTYNFDNGQGYLEKDSGTSFPRSYLWLQCNDFPEHCSIMVSIAHIPFAGTSFTGCICAIVFGESEYRLATYKGVRIHSSGPEHICLSQGRLLLELDILAPDSGQLLRSPKNGQMSATVRESCNVSVRARLWENGEKIFDTCSSYATFEFVE